MSPRGGARASGTFSGLTVIVVGINYAPETTGIAPYTTDLCEFLASEGADVTALVGLPHYPEWRTPESFRQSHSRSEELNGVQIIRCPHYVPSSQSAARRGLYEATFMRSSRRAGTGRKADLVIAVSPSLSGLRTGRYLAERTGAPLAAVVQDLMGSSAAQSGISGGRSVARLVHRAELDALRAADLVAVISPSFTGILVEGGIDPNRIRLLRNFSHIPAVRATRNDARLQLGWDRSQQIALHTGNMGLKQDLGNIVGAARLALPHRPDLRFIVMGDGSQRRELESSARGLTNITFVDPLPNELYPLALAAADVLLLNERPTVRDMSLPSKLTSYFASGRAVVGAVPEGGATALELQASGGAVLTAPGDPAALLRAIRLLLEDEVRRDDLGMQGRAYAQAALGRDAAHDRIGSLVRELVGLSGVPVPVSPRAMLEPARSPSIA